MFDQYHHHSHSTYQTKTVHEHRAPTDESIRLAQEMECKVLAKILGSVRLEGCEFSCVVHRMADDLNSDTIFVIDYKIGSKANRVNYRHRSFDFGREAIVSGLMKTLSEDIARTLLQHAFPSGLAKILA